jgi:hypothetical protein
MRAIVVPVLGALALVACQPQPGAATGDEPLGDVGAVSLQLELGTAYRFNAVHYEIDGAGYHAAADVDVTNSSTFTAIVGAVPFGHYTAQLTAREADGKLTPCTGTASFDVTSTVQLAVPVHMTCREVLPPSSAPAVPVPRGATIALGVLLAVLGAARARGRRTLAALTLATAVSAGGASGCAGEATDASTQIAGDTGSARLALLVAPGITLDAIDYRIDGPGAFMKQGSIDVSNSATVSARIAPLPPGNNFTIEMRADGTDGDSMCEGAATFAIAARQTTSVVVHMFCKQRPRNVGVSVAAAINTCPLVDSMAASPAEVFVGTSIALAAVAHDTNAGPAPLAYHWTASSGTLSDASAPSPLLTCTAPGAVSVSLTVDDGELAAGCPDTQTITVTCTAVAP